MRIPLPWPPPTRPPPSPALQVIYHLNNKSEDLELELQGLTVQHDAELEAMQRDAAAKLAGLQRQLDQQLDVQRIQEAAAVRAVA